MNSTLKVAEYRSFARIFSKIRKKPAFERIKKQVSMVGSMWQKCFFREVLWHNEIQTLKCQFWNDAKAFSANSGYLKPLLIFSFSASISSTDFFPSDL